MYLFRHPAFDPSNCLSTYLLFSHLFSVFCLPTSPPIFSVTKLWIYLHSHWSIFIYFHFSIGLLISLSLSPICLSIYSSLNHILSLSHSFIFSSVNPLILPSSLLFSHPSFHPFTHLHIISAVHLSADSFSYLSSHPSISLPFHPFFLQVQSSIYLLTHPSIFSSFQLSICIPTVTSGA